MKKRIILFIFILTVFFTAACSAPAQNDKIMKTFFCFDTVITIQIWGNDDYSLLEQCEDLCVEYEHKFSRTLEGSEIDKINQAHGTPVTVSDDTIALIEKGLYYSQLSQGAFDITIAPLSSLWNFKTDTARIPDHSDILETLTHIDYNCVKINGNTVTLKDPYAAIDLGGIAKGYIADKLKSFLMDNNVTSAAISLGGNVLTIGEKMNGDAFLIGIQKPFDEQNAVITSLEIRDKSVVTSGCYERYFQLDDELYHHILNPKTGYPYQNELLSVTIISEQSVDGDALSTVCFALGLEKGLELINSLDNVEAIFITSDYVLHYSEQV